jgi:hypothetical protein
MHRAAALLAMDAALLAIALAAAVATGGGTVPSSAAAAAAAPASGLRAQFFSNAVLLEPACTAITATPAAMRIDAAGLREICGGGLSPELFSVRMHGQLQLPPAQYQMKTQSSGALRFWVHGWKLVDEFAVPLAGAAETIGKYNFTVVSNATYPVRLDALFTSLPATIAISYREVGTSEWKVLEPTALAPTVDPNEQRRQDLQLSLARGWNTWHRASATAHVHLPSAFGFDVSIVDPARNMTFSKGIVDRCQPDAAGRDGLSCRVRPSTHTFNGSFTHFDQTVRKDLVVTVKSAHTGSGSGDGTVVCLRADAGADPAAVAQLQLQVATRYYFDCAPRAYPDVGAVPCGNVSALPDGSGLQASPVGLPPVSLYAIGAEVAILPGGQGLNMKMAGGGVACLVATSGAAASRGRPLTLAASEAVVKEAEAAVEREIAAEYPREKVGASRDVVDALRAVMVRADGKRHSFACLKLPYVFVPSMSWQTIMFNVKV